MAQQLTIEAPIIKTIEINIQGTNSLICHKWSEKTKQDILDKQLKKPTIGRRTKDPEQDYKESLYPHPEGGYGFPAIAFKLAAVRAAKQTGMAMTDARALFYINGDMVKIKGKPSMREDMVKVQGSADIRYRGEFKQWSASLRITINESVVSIEQIVNLFSLAGMSVGIGEWRPEKNGQFGTFKILGGNDNGIQMESRGKNKSQSSSRRRRAGTN